MIIGRQLIERLYSKNDENEMEYRYNKNYYYRSYSDSENSDKKDSKIYNVKSHRGLGRATVIGGTGGIFGYKAGKRAADVAEAEGKSDKEILKKAKRKGALVGALSGAGIGATGTAIGNIIDGSDAKTTLINSLKVGAKHATKGAIGGLLGTKKNTKERLVKKHLIEE